MNSEYNYREIPYNYTSYSDKEIILKYFDNEIWDLMNELRATRVTGRSAKLLFELIGDIFIIDRNPYIFNDFQENPIKLKRLHKLHKRRLDTIRKGTSLPSVEKILNAAEKVDRAFFKQFSTVTREQHNITRHLRSATSHKNIQFSALHKVMHVTDATDWRMEYPQVVVYPDSISEIPKLIAAARKLNMSIIPRGAGTGLTGGAVPINKNTMVINTEKLRNIGEITMVENEETTFPVIEVEAGVVTDNAMKHCQKLGYIFATDPTSAWASTIGGNIAENCGGKKAVMWGTAIDNIYSYKMVFPDGSLKNIVRRNHPHRKILPEDTVIYDIFPEKSSTPEKTITLSGTDIRKKGVGKDITNKALGGLPGIQKEGGDGVIVSGTFVLYTPFTSKKTLCLEFYGNTMTNASKAIVEILDRFKEDKNSFLTALEHWDDKYCDAINYRNKSDRSEKPKAVLLIDVESNHLAFLENACSNIIKDLHRYNTEGFIAQDEKSQQAFWKDRKNLGAIARHTNAFKLNEDVVIPIESLPGFAEFIDRLNIEKELSNNLQCIDAIEETMQNITEEDPFFLSKIDVISKNCLKVKNKYTTYLSSLDSQYPDDTKHTWFTALREKLVSLDIEHDILTPLKETFHGYDDIISLIIEKAESVIGRKIIIATHMHAGDGNIHVNIPVHSSDYLMMQEADETAGIIMKKTVELHGVISGEHGIGLTKLRFISDDILNKYAKYKQEADPENRFNPGKLTRSLELSKTYTPSLNLLKTEAFILETADLKDLTSSISGCVRCGKCKEVCNTQYARGNLHYSPRNKILGVNLITEAVLYESQTSNALTFRNFEMLRDISNHCTMCHKCAPPCPVNIDFGDVTLDIRDLLTTRKRASSKVVTEMTLFYLRRRGYYINKLFRIGLLKIAFSFQRLGYHLNRPVKHITRKAVPFIASMLSGKMRKAGDPTFRDVFKLTESNTFYAIAKNHNDVADSVIYFPGCGSERMFSEISFAVIALLYHAGVRVVLPPEYLCCGYPLLANGKVKLAEMKSFENRVLFHRMADTIGYMEIKNIVVSCGTCFEMLEKYQLGHIFHGSSVRDINEYISLNNLYHTDKNESYLYHDPCHSPLKNHGYEKTFSSILSSSPVSVPNCCGEGGTLALSTPVIAEKLRDRKKVNIMNFTSKKKVEILTTCPSCVQGLTKIQNSIKVEGKSLAVHLAETFLGKNWKRDLIRDIKKNNGIERIIF